MNPVRNKHPKKATSLLTKKRISNGMNQLSILINNHGYKVYPVLFAIFPLLSFYSVNQSEIRSGNFNLTSFIIFNLVVVGIIWPLAWLSIQNAKKASILAVAALVLFFSFGRVHDHIQSIVIKTPITPIGPTKILLLASVILLVLAWLGTRRLAPKSTDTANLSLTVVGTYLIISSLISITWPRLSSQNSIPQNNQKVALKANTKTNKRDLPDIYYILLDGYARADILKSNFGYDNSSFIDALKTRGFYVAEKSHSNYAHTHLSVPSTFNMKYLNYLTKQLGEDSSDRTPLQRLTTYNEVVPTFKSFGYKYVNIGSQWGWTITSPLADVDVKTETEAHSKILNIKLDEFALVYLQTTAIKPWIASSIGGTLLSRVLGAFERTEKVSTIAEPTLSFSHIVSPHPPYLFNRNGPIPGLTTKLALDNPGFSDKKGYVEQLIYTNKLTLHMVDTILKNSNNPPIIIIASDHGPASTLSQADFGQTDPTKFNVKGIRERMANLNSYYFPDHKYQQLYPNITPVNTFRLILKQYFNQDIKLLPDNSYFSDNKANQYRLLDVTDLVK